MDVILDDEEHGLVFTGILDQFDESLYCDATPEQVEFGLHYYPLPKRRQSRKARRRPVMQRSSWLVSIFAVVAWVAGIAAYDNWTHPRPDLPTKPPPTAEAPFRVLCNASITDRPECDPPKPAYAEPPRPTLCETSPTGGGYRSTFCVR
jgi:hypothetical protein